MEGKSQTHKVLPDFYFFHSMPFLQFGSPHADMLKNFVSFARAVAEKTNLIANKDEKSEETERCGGRK